MTEQAERLDLVINKGARFYQEFQLVEDDLSPISIADKTVRCVIRESWKSTTVLFNLTVDNGGVVLDDSLNGVFGLLLNANQTNIAQTVGIYDVLLVDNDHPTLDSDRVVAGKIVFSPGLAIEELDTSA